MEGPDSIRFEGVDEPETPEQKAFREAEERLTPEQRESRARKAQEESDKQMQDFLDSNEDNALEKAIAELKRPPSGPGLRHEL